MQNNQFLASIKSLRRTLPTLGWGMLALVYGVSAIAGGAFLANLMDNQALAYAIAICIQATRAVIVFFPQMNPSRPAFGWGGELAAILFGGLSIYEMYSLINGSNYDEAVFVSVAVLMFAGIIIEVLMLKEVKFATEQELLSDPKQYAAIRKLYIDRYRLQEELARIREGEGEEEAPVVVQAAEAAPVPPVSPVAPVPPVSPANQAFDISAAVATAHDVWQETMIQHPPARTAHALNGSANGSNPGELVAHR
jgi:hypothetical protein